MSIDHLKMEASELDLLYGLDDSLQQVGPSEEESGSMNQLGAINNNNGGSGNVGVGSGGGGSTDFVKKLFQMLEADKYKKIVRWTESGDSFIITDTNEFTKDVLPKHFKHSNFASFVRQLNKYDFHKVKMSSEDKRLGKNKLESGENIWEFKHPDFRIHDRESLENIKRKGPTQKKTPVEKLLDSVGKLTNQVKELKEESKELSEELHLIKSKYNTVIEGLLNMKKVNDSYQTLFNNLTNYLSSQGIKVPPFEPPRNLPQQPPQQPPPNTNNTTSTSTILTSSTAGGSANYPDQRRRTSSTSTLPQQTRTTQQPPPSQLHLAIVTEPLAPNASLTNTPTQQVKSEPIGAQVPVSTASSVVVPSRPPNSPFHVLLVEDDAVCIQLCRKFLMKYGCTVEVVTDGLSLISFVEKVKYDLVLMDIVMPNLDGATATSVIRSFDSTTPIIAMTGNIQDNDLLTYLRNGMTDILAKPFSQHDLFAMLEKHLRNGGVDLNIDDPLVKKQRLA